MSSLPIVVIFFLAVLIITIFVHLFVKQTNRHYIIKDNYYRMLFLAGLFFIVLGVLWSSMIIIMQGFLLMVLSVIEHKTKDKTLSSEDEVVKRANELIAREHALKLKEKQLKKQIEHVYKMAKVVDRHAKKQ